MMMIINFMKISTTHDDHHQGPANIGQPASGGPPSCGSSEGRDLFLLRILLGLLLLLSQGHDQLEI